MLVLVFGSVPFGIILPVYAQGEYVAFPETVSISSSDLVPHNFILKAISKQNGDVEKVSGLKLDPINVISVLEGGTISATSTDQSIVFERAKAKSSTDSLFELQKINDGFSIAGLVPGVYTLDIIAAKNTAKAAYEGILVIGQNAESQEVKQVVEREITEVDQGTTIENIIPIFQLPPNPPNPQPAPGPLIIQQQQGQQQQQPAAIPPGGQAPVNPSAPRALAGQQPLSPAAAAAPSDIPPDGTPCTGVDNVDIGVYKNGKCTPETLPPEPSLPQAPTPPLGTIPSCILTADCPPSPPPQALAADTDGSEPVDLASTNPNDPLFGGAGEGEEGTEGTDELARESEDSESESESDGEGDGGGNGDSGDGGGDGDSGDGDSGDGGDGGGEGSE